MLNIAKTLRTIIALEGFSCKLLKNLKHSIETNLVPTRGIKHFMASNSSFRVRHIMQHALILACKAFPTKVKSRLVSPSP